MAKYSINLLQPELIAKQPTLTLARVVSLWVFVFIAMLLWLTWSHYQLNDSKKQVAKSTLAKEALVTQQMTLESQVASNKADTALVEQLATVKLLFKNKQLLHQQLTDTSSTHAAGFSAAMTELSQYHHRDISLKQVTISGDYIRFSGVANTPESVPLWLAAFEQSTFLSGHVFSHFTLQENDQKLTEFVISSRQQTGKEQ
ncbi:PilN domain-containing protein [Thalassotalea hakodatensis]|uniref:PilN domain-containing protein n=1 Tax=Thalassotalea hakodatensis TaxID=3030492 RepID=UPI0025748FA2|nr:PilN domain-containing protein [Thalassotalea hakodatensis]